MSQRLPLFRAARLVGISRRSLQRRIHDEGVESFEGQILIDDLLKLFPDTALENDSEYERVQHIKKHAFAKRVRKHLLPSADVLAARLTELGQELATTRAHLALYQTILEQITLRLREAGENPSKQEVHGLLHWIKGILAESPATNDPQKDLFINDTVLRIMAAHVKIHPSNHEFWLEGNDSLLDAGVRAGLSLNYGCTSGSCGLCKARVISGEVKKIRQHDYVLSEAEKNMRYILMCSCTAVNDVVLEALEASSEEDIPLQEISTRLKRIERPNEQILILHLQTPRVQRLRFLAGQSVNLSLDNGASAGLPIASCPCDDRNLLFHIPRADDSAFWETVNGLKKGDNVIVSGPGGQFRFNENSQRRQLYIAYGAGFAPIKSIIEHAMALETPASMELYWSVNQQEDLYLHNLCRAWDDALEDFSYHPSIAVNPVDTLLDQPDTLMDADVYLAGPAQQVESAQQRLLAAGLPAEQLITTSIAPV